MICDNCAWSKVEEEFEYCKDFRKGNFTDCPRFYPFDYGDEEEDGPCECGAEKLKSPRHSDWCNKYRRE